MPETDGKVETHEIRQYRLYDGEVEFVGILGEDLQCVEAVRLTVRTVTQGFEHLTGGRADGVIVIHNQYAK
jgi:hypothetical protein